MASFFGKPDLDARTGKITSQYPAWYFDNQVEELRENVERKERDLKKGVIPLDVLPEYESDLAKEKQRLQDIIESKPKLSDVEKDKYVKQYNDFGKKIQNSMFTHTEMDMGYASANEEARRMSEGVIDVRDKEIEILKDMGINHVNGKISRNQAVKAWQILGKLLGEDTNAERLRKAGTTSRRYIVK